MKTYALGFFTPWLLYGWITILHLVLPGRWYDGYVAHEKTGETLRYRLNGLLVLLVSVGLWALAGWMKWVPWNWLYLHRWEGLAGACVLGLLFTFVMVLPAPSTGKPLLVDLFLGRPKNPQLWGGRIDAKMWLYLIGAVMLELNVLSFAAHHVMKYGSSASHGVYLCAGLLTYFVCDYLTFERVHLYTYDIFAERVGFKLGWGCLTFYPYFYAVGLWSVADKPSPNTPTSLLALYGLIFLLGWSLARGANMQKFTFKTRPEATFLGMKPIALTDGTRTLLASGFWGVSRHINYLGEILMGVGIALSVGYPSSFWPWLYPLYYVALLVPRQFDDDRRCKAKYGELWDKYEEKVPYRIIPGVF